MGEYNETIREQEKWKQRITFLTETYRDASCSQLDFLKSISDEEKRAVKEVFQSGHQMYMKELNKLRITGKGEIYYGDDLYHAKDAVACIIKQHIEILEHTLHEYFRSYDKILGINKQYGEFLDDFVKYRRAH